MARPVRQTKPVGIPTRGTTAPNRLRRIDRWLTSPRLAAVLRRAPDPLVVDLGFGASPVTTIELAARLRVVRSDVEVVGIEIDPQRVAVARELAGVRGVRADFHRGGFELGPLAGRRPVIVRAANVWRQYPVEEVASGWTRVAALLTAGGILVDATCDEIGRLATWLAVPSEPSGPAAGSPAPVSLTVSMRLAGLQQPSVVAERLPKTLIHRNVPGERVHDFLRSLDHAWHRAAPLAGHGARQRFIQACRTLRDEGWPLLDGPARWRLGEVSVAWGAVAPYR